MSEIVAGTVIAVRVAGPEVVAVARSPVAVFVAVLIILMLAPFIHGGAAVFIHTLMLLLAAPARMGLISVRRAWTQRLSVSVVPVGCSGGVARATTAVIIVVIVVVAPSRIELRRCHRYAESRN